MSNQSASCLTSDSGLGEFGRALAAAIDSGDAGDFSKQNMSALGSAVAYSPNKEDGLLAFLAGLGEAPLGDDASEGEPNSEVESSLGNVESIEQARSQRARQERIRVYKAIQEAHTSADGLLMGYIEQFESETGQLSRFGFVPRLLTQELSYIFGNRRNPGTVFDEAVGCCFAQGEGSLDLKEELQGLERAWRRLHRDPSSYVWLILVMFGWGAASDADSDELDESSEPDAGSDEGSVRMGPLMLVVAVICDFQEISDDDRIRLGFYLGGKLGWLVLRPLMVKWQRRDDASDWSEDERRLATQWGTLAANPLIARPEAPDHLSYTAPELWLSRLDAMRGLGWSAATDFFVQVEALYGEWAWDPPRDTFHWNLLATVRAGCATALLQADGRFETGPLDALKIAIARDWIASEIRFPELPWPYAIGLVPLIADCHRSHWFLQEMIPDEHSTWRCVKDCLAANQYELAEALASLWFLQRLILEKPADDLAASISSEYWIELFARQPRPYGYLGPVAEYLVRWFDAPEYTGLGGELVYELTAVAAAFRVPDSESISFSPGEVSETSARTILGTRLIGDTFLQLPSEVKTKLIDAVKWMVVIERFEIGGGEQFKRFNGQLVDFCVALEVLIKERLNGLSATCLAELEQVGLKWSDRASLGNMAKLFKRYKDLPKGAQAEIRGAIPALPLTKRQLDSMYDLVDLRNRGAHCTSCREDMDKMKDILFQRIEGERVERGLFDLLGRLN